MYAHFPDDRSLFEACSGHVRATAPPPDPTGWRSISDPAERLEVALRELYGYYEDLELLLENVERDAAVMPIVAEMNAYGVRYLEEVRDLLLEAWKVRGGARARLRRALGHALAFGTPGSRSSAGKGARPACDPSELRLKSDFAMANFLTRRELLVAAAPAVAAAPLLKLAIDQPAAAGTEDHAAMNHGSAGHSAMSGATAPAPGGPHDLDALLYPPDPLPHQPGRVREYEIAAVDREIEVASGVSFAAWTYNGAVPGPVLRATEDDLLRVRFVNAGSHPHTIHFHGIHPANMDGVFEIVEPGDSYTYEFPARPYGMQLYHCHSTPLKKHIAKGLYGALIIDPPTPRPPALELVMVLSGFDTDGDGANNFYGVNGPAFYYAKYPIRVRRSRTVRIYLANLTEFDLINSFHLHGDFFRYYATGSGESFEYTDTVMLCQGQRGIVEIDFHNTGKFMFHAHQSEFTELGWMGFFEVIE